eukprot:TRINITY_DN29431_c0_g1_i1.p1 TRINITY_DN29431_c0_g1~~TRINITY_DN29431_c0_g1_i1.p1  ORF type:complete len:117 (-),score=6.31 TRINITY_DN29431_c0_g1_i1:331-681(-)
MVTNKQKSLDRSQAMAVPIKRYGYILDDILNHRGTPPSLKQSLKESKCTSTPKIDQKLDVGPTAPPKKRRIGNLLRATSPSKQIRSRLSSILPISTLRELFGEIENIEIRWMDQKL